MPLTKGMKRAQRFGQHRGGRPARGQSSKQQPNPQSPTPSEEEKTPIQSPDTPPVKLDPYQPTTVPEPLPETPSPVSVLPILPASSTVLITNGPNGPRTWAINDYEAPPRELVQETIQVLEARINPKRKSGVGHKRPKLNPLAVKDLNSVLEFFRAYVTMDVTWCQASLNTSRVKGHGEGHGRTLRKWGRACILNPQFIPQTAYGQNQDSLITQDEFREALQTYLQNIGKYVTAMDVVRFTSQSDVQTTWKLTKPVSKSTAQRWMRELSYRWRREPKGLYLDGHERPDVVEYRQKVYLERWKQMEPRMQSYAAAEIYTYMDPIIRRIVVWYHDECIFYANDRRLVIWVPSSAPHKPVKKGEGLALMASDLISAEYGWLRSPDGAEHARVLFRVGINRDGYFSTSHVCEQIAHAADILSRHYTGEDHIFIFDNSPTHRKREPDAPSAQRMPKWPPDTKKGGKNFLVRTADADGNEIEVPMTGAYFSDGQPQSLYWPEGDPNHKAGWFKGMAQILKERGWKNTESINGKCRLKCDPQRTNCCLRRILYNEPDFANPMSILERLVTSRGHGFLLLPKFHPELNAIERVWGRAKRTYRVLPESVGENQLRKNVEEALNDVKLEEMRKFCTLVRRICDGYNKGLVGPLAAWAQKMFHGHRQYPENILEKAQAALELSKDID